MTRALLLGLGLAACGGSASSTFDDAAIQDVAIEPDAAAALPVNFTFAIVGDTRPANEDDLAGYPSSVIHTIWGEVEAMSPHPAFAVSTGDYMFANASRPAATSTVDYQLDLYLAARAQFTSAAFAAMGNHECTGATDSNCGPGSADGVTFNYTEYMRRMVTPFGFTEPYFVYAFHAADNSWTAKVVFVAANAWNPTQAEWLDQTLAQPTTYTFVVRHESVNADTAPGVPASEVTIAKYPLTMKIVGHTHTYAHYASDHEAVCGNGGAPLTSGANFGYAIVERLANGAIQLTDYDYSSGAVVDQWRVNADGTPAP